MKDKKTRTIKSNHKPKSWPVRFKSFLSCGWHKVFGKHLFKFNIYDHFGPAPHWQQKMTRRWQAFSKETNFLYAIGLFILCTVFALAWWPRAPEIWTDIWVEFVGLIFDIFFILIVFSLFETRRQRSQEVQRQHEIIDDYKRWDSPEAHFRIAGAIRRLNKREVYAVNLSGTRISDFSFAKNGIGRLDGSIFYDGTWGKPLADGTVELTRVKFDHVSCKSVQFSPSDPFQGLGVSSTRYARFIDCSFWECDLKKAIFNGASLTWTVPPPDSHYERLDDGEYGDPQRVQTSYGPFDGSDLNGASFVDTVFENADFRGAKNIMEADFTDSEGLEKAVFDDNKIKAAVLAKLKK